MAQCPTLRHLAIWDMSHRSLVLFQGRGASMLKCRRQLGKAGTLLHPCGACAGAGACTQLDKLKPQLQQITFTELAARNGSKWCRVWGALAPGTWPSMMHQ